MTKAQSIDNSTYLYKFIGYSSNELTSFYFIAPISAIILLNAYNWCLFFKARRKIINIKNPTRRSTFNILSVIVLRAVQVTLLMNWLISAFRILFFCLKG